MGTSIYDWSQTPIENEASDGEINWNENQDPGTVNNSARAMMARIRAHIADITPSRASTGSANIYAINIASAPSSLVDGLTVAFRAHQANTGSSILQVNSFGSIPLRSVSGSALHANEIMAGRPVVAAYNASINEWLIINGLPQLAQLYGDILTESDVQDIASAYVQANPDDVRAALWVMRPVASAVTTTPPSSATDGTLYLVPTGASSPWNTKAGLVAEAAAGSWTYHSPADGWSVCPKDTPGTVWLYINAAWTSIAAAGSTATNRKAMVVRYEQPNGTDGGAVTTGSRQTYPINAVVNGSATNFITGAALASNKISGLPVGVYDIIGSAYHYATNSFKLFLVNVTTATDVIVGVDSYAQNNSPVMASNAILVGSFEVTNSAHEYAIQYRAQSNGGANSLGLSGSYSEGVEIYGQFQIVSAATERGSNGSTGAQGPGGAGYLASSATSLTIGTGTQTLTTSSGLAYRAGDVIKIADTAAPSTNYMLGTITSYSSTSMVASVTETAGSGTKTAWTISLAGKTGTTGTAGTNGTGYGGTSSTSLLIGTGSKVWGTQAGLGYVVGSRIRWANSSTNWMEGQITDYTSTSMTVNVTKTSGSGTLAFWSASIAGEPGADGAGSGTVTDISLSGGLESDAGGTITASGSGRQAISTVVETTTTRAIGVGDRAKLIEFTNVSAKSVTLAQAQNSNRATMGFTGWFCWVLNMGAGTLTVTPTTSTIAGAASLSLANTEGALIVSDGTNYKAMTFRAGGAVDIYSIVNALTAETAPSISDEIELQDVSVPAARRMTLQNVFKVIGGLAAETAPAADDILPLFDTSAGTTDGITVANFFKSIAQLTADTTPDVADSIATYDASASAAKSVTISNLLKTINALTEDTSPAVTADYVATYDTSATAAKKVLLQKIGTGRISIPIDSTQFALGTSTTRTTATIGSAPITQARNVVNLGGSAGATANTAIFCGIRIPKGVSVSSLAVQIEWSQATTNATAGVVFTAAALCTSDGDSFDQAYGTAVNCADSGGTLNTTYLTDESAAITPSNTPTAQDCLWVKIGRDVAHASDTLAQFARISQVIFHLTTTANTAD